MGLRAIGVAMLASAAACGSEELDPESPPTSELEPARFDTLCGRDEPVRLFAVPEGETLALSSLHDMRWRGGWLAVTRRCPDETCPPWAAESMVLYWLGPCGERWGVLELEIASLFLPSLEMGHVIGCSGDGDIVAIDPEQGSSRTIATGWSCHMLLFDEGLVASRPVDDEHFELVWIPSLDDLDLSNVLLDVVAKGGPLPRVRASTKGVLVMTDEDALVAIDPRDDQQPIRLAENVGDFHVSDDGAFVLWQELEPFTEGVSNHPLWVVDLTTEETIHAGWGRLGDNAGVMSGFTVAHADPGLGGRWLVLLPELEPMHLLPRLRPRLRAEDGRLFVQDEASDATVLLAPSGDVVPVCTSRCAVRSTPWGYDLQEGGLLSRFELDGTKTAVAQGFGSVVRIGPNRVLGDRGSELVVFDESDPEPRLVARDTVGLHGPLLERHPAATVEDPFVFQVIEDGRDTLWAVALAP